MKRPASRDPQPEKLFPKPPADCKPFHFEGGVIYSSVEKRHFRYKLRTSDRIDYRVKWGQSDATKADAFRKCCSKIREQP